MEECDCFNGRRGVMEENCNDVIPADVAEEFYFTACLEDLTKKDLQVLLAYYACPSHDHLTWAQCRELTTFVEQWRHMVGRPSRRGSTGCTRGAQPFRYCTRAGRIEIE
jgi:hypothetical protein